MEIERFLGCQVLNSFRAEELIKYKKPDLIDILPRLRLGNREDMIVIKAWAEYFESKDCPYVVVRNEQSTLTMWKKRRVRPE